MQKLLNNYKHQGPNRKLVPRGGSFHWKIELFDPSIVMPIVRGFKNSENF